ncbi:hypothetical protein D4Q76_02710 [archaeon]|nr:MAG: hypothetical protein D4Q76_02710 [archaeon]
MKIRWLKMVTVMDAFTISFIGNMFLVVAVGLMFFVSRGFFGTLLKVRFFKKTPMLVARRDGKMDYLAVEKKAEVLRSAQYGDFSIVPKTTYMLGGMRTGLVYESFAGTLTTEFLEATNQLDAIGIKTYSEMDAIARGARGAPPTLNKDGSVLSPGIPTIYQEMAEVAKGFNAYAKILKDKKATPEQKAEAEEKLRVYKKYLESLDRTTKSIDVVRNFFLYNFNPNTWKATLDRAVSDMKKENKMGDIMKWILPAMLIIMIGVIAYVMVMQSGVQNAASAVGGAGQNLLPDLSAISGGGSAIK